MPIYLIVKTLEKFKQQTYSDYMHAVLHYWLILSTICLLKNKS